MGFGVIGADVINIIFLFPVQLQFGQTFLNLAFSCYRQLQFFN